MINFLRVLSLPSVSMSERRKLPKESGIYYLRLGFKVEYIGQSTSLRHRWTNEGDWKHKQRIRIEKSRDYGRYRLHYRTVPSHKRDFVEYSEIELFKPSENKKMLDPKQFVDWKLRLELMTVDLLWMLGIGVGLTAVLLMIWRR